MMQNISNDEFLFYMLCGKIIENRSSAAIVFVSAKKNLNKVSINMISLYGNSVAQYSAWEQPEIVKYKDTFYFARFTNKNELLKTLVKIWDSSSIINLNKISEVLNDFNNK